MVSITIPQPVRDLLAEKQWKTAVVAAIRLGNRDEKALVSMIFNADFCRLTKGLGLRKCMEVIRNDIVRPSLANTVLVPGNQGGPIECFMTIYLRSKT